MLRASPPRRDALCNVARGIGRILSAMAPAGVPNPLGSLVSSGGGSSTFHTQYDDGSRDTPSRILIQKDQPAGASPLSYESKDLPETLVDELARSSQAYQHGKTNMRYKAVPATQVSRAAGFGSLFVQLAWEKVAGSGTPEGGLLSSSGHQRIVDTLCRMRGAVLKLGQMLSIQDSNTVPPHVTALFEKVRDQAFAMPTTQLQKTLAHEFGGNAAWREDLFEAFNEVPVAAASIGQVHVGRLRPGVVPAAAEDDLTFSTKVAPGVAVSETPLDVAVKVQYPGVAKSIDSDVANLKMLMSLNILPPGMFVDSILKELRNELSMECQYTIEGAKQERYRRLVEEDSGLREAFHVPRVYRCLSTDQVLVSEFVRGIPIDQLAKRTDVPQEFRNFISDKFMRLTLNELFRWRFMQTDPNYANFLYDATSRKINLLDFGAAREYEAAFVRDYLDVVAAAARGDRETIIEKSISLGFLTGREVKEMMDAHVGSVMTLGKPFRSETEPFNFAAENLPAQIKEFVPTMVKLRLRPPPTPVYSLHRRLSGTILLATKFGATIPSGPTFWQIYEDVKNSF